VLITGPYQTLSTAECVLSGASVTGNTVTDPGNVGGGLSDEGKLTVTSVSVSGHSPDKVFTEQELTTRGCRTPAINGR